jgi:phosphoglycerol transferase MdoB-like AlkP superfamily enzyme
MKNRKKTLTFRLILALIISIITIVTAVYFKSVYINLKLLFTFIQALGIVISVPSVIGLIAIFANYLCDVIDED